MPRSTALLLLSAMLAGTGVVALESTSRAAAQSRVPLLNVKPPTPRPAPAWRNESWLNTDRPLTVESLKGRVALLNFWVFTCYNCTNTVPSLIEFDRKYRPQGLTLIGIHTPEFPPYAGEHDKANVERALKKYGIDYPVAQDNDNRTWNLYDIRYWPSFVLIDKRGRIRYEGYGEFHVNDDNYALWAHRIEELLASICAERERVCRSVAIAVSGAVYSRDASPRPPESHRPLAPADPAQAHPPS